MLAVLLARPLPAGAAPPQADLPRIPGASAEVVRVDAVVTDGKGRLLFRDGRRVADVPIRVESPLAPQEGVTAVSGSLRLSTQMEPGPHMLEVLVRDELRPEKDSLAIQWIDFEIGDAAR